jgi:hypothetical protein
MKTIIIYETFTDPIKFYVIDGDYSHLNGVYSNGDAEETAQDELNNLVFNEDWTYKPAYNDFPQHVFEEHNACAVSVIVCGFLP